jgi:hypothetical protein
LEAKRKADEESAKGTGARKSDGRGDKDVIAKSEMRSMLRELMGMGVFGAKLGVGSSNLKFGAYAK